MENNENKESKETKVPEQIQHITQTVKEKTGLILKRYLVTGLIVIIPLWLTFFIVSILFNWISNFTSPYLIPILSYFMSDRTWVIGLAKIISFFVSIGSICLLGFITNRVFGRTVLNFLERLIKKLPLLGTVHSAAKQFVSFIFGKDKKKGFKKVVFVPYPHKGVYGAAFLTGEQTVNGEKHVCVFMPTTPNPTTGFLLMYKEDEIVHTNFTIDEAFQFIISIGVISMDKDKKADKETQNKIEEIKDELIQSTKRDS